MSVSGNLSQIGTFSRAGNWQLFRKYPLLATLVGKADVPAVISEMQNGYRPITCPLRARSSGGTAWRTKAVEPSLRHRGDAGKFLVKQPERLARPGISVRAPQKHTPYRPSGWRAAHSEPMPLIDSSELRNCPEVTRQGTSRRLASSCLTLPEETRLARSDLVQELRWHKIR